MEATAMGLLVLNLVLGYASMDTSVFILKMFAYIALVIIDGGIIFYMIHKIVSQKVFTFGDKILQRISFKSAIEAKEMSLDGLLKGDELLENDETNLKSESESESESESFESFADTNSSLKDNEDQNRSHDQIQDQDQDQGNSHVIL